MPKSDSTRHERDFASVAGELTSLSAQVLTELTVEAAKRKTSPAQLALQKGLLDAVQIDIIETLLRPTEVVPGYEILGVLGHGGMGVVYRARQLNLQRVVALKTVLVNQVGQQSALDRFAQEAQAVARLTHPHIVAAYDFGRHEGRLFFAMELVAGEDAYKLIRRRGPLDERTVWGIVRQAAAGLAHAAEHGVVHRDIKPGNLLLVAPPAGYALPAGLPMVKIADFGLAQLAAAGDERTRLTSAHTAIGSLHYMSPEQLMAGDVDLRTDIFALGASAFHMLTGQPPQAGRSLSQIIAQRMGQQQESVLEHRADVSHDSAELVAAMMTHDRDARIADYRQLLARIDSLQVSSSADLPTEVYASTPLASVQTKAMTQEPTLPLVRRQRMPSKKVWFVGIGLAALLLLAGYIAWPGRSAGARDLARSGRLEELFSGQNITPWQTLSGGWGQARNHEGAVVLEGRGLVRRSIATRGDTGELVAPAHYVLTLLLDRHNATAVEVQFDLPADQSDERYLLLRMDREGASLCRRVKAGSPAKTIAYRANRDSAATLHAIEMERHSQGWWVLLDGTPLGSAPFEHATPAPEFRLVSEGGPAWFSDFTVEELAARDAE